MLAPHARKVQNLFGFMTTGTFCGFFTGWDHVVEVQFFLRGRYKEIAVPISAHDLSGE
jgi:hypothetical protein